MNLRRCPGWVMAWSSASARAQTGSCPRERCPRVPPASEHAACFLPVACCLPVACVLPASRLLPAACFPACRLRSWPRALLCALRGTASARPGAVSHPHATSQCPAGAPPRSAQPCPYSWLTVAPCSMLRVACPTPKTGQETKCILKMYSKNVFSRPCPPGASRAMRRCESQQSSPGRRRLASGWC